MRNSLHDLSELGMLFGKVDCFLLKVCVLPRPTMMQWLCWSSLHLVAMKTLSILVWSPWQKKLIEMAMKNGPSFTSQVWLKPFHRRSIRQSFHQTLMMSFGMTCDLPNRQRGCRWNTTCRRDITGSFGAGTEVPSWSRGNGCMISPATSCWRLSLWFLYPWPEAQWTDAPTSPRCHGRQADTCFPCFAPAPEGGLQRQLYRGCSLGVIHLDLVDWNLDRLAECVFVGALLAIVIAIAVPRKNDSNVKSFMNLYPAASSMLEYFGTPTQAHNNPFSPTLLQPKAEASLPFELLTDHLRETACLILIIQGCCSLFRCDRCTPGADT